MNKANRVSVNTEDAEDAEVIYYVIKGQSSLYRADFQEHPKRDKIEQALFNIHIRYETLKKHNSFTYSEKQACIEWLIDYLKEK